MRKSSTFSMIIILLALVSMMVAADMALKPMKHTMGIGKDLTAMLQARGDLAPESRVLVMAHAAEARHLADSGWGLIIEVEPSQAVRSRKGRLGKLARRVVGEAGRLYRARRGRRVEWYEVRFGKGEAAWHRTLLRVGEEGRVGPAQPAVPPVYVAKVD